MHAHSLQIGIAAMAALPAARRNDPKSDEGHPSGEIRSVHVRVGAACVCFRVCIFREPRLLVGLFPVMYIVLIHPV